MANLYYSSISGNKSQEWQHEKEILTIKLEQKGRELTQLQKDYEWLKGVYSVTVTKALPEPKQHWWQKLKIGHKKEV